MSCTSNDLPDHQHDAHGLHVLYEQCFGKATASYDLVWLHNALSRTFPGDQTDPVI